MILREQIHNNLDEASKENNETEKTISLQLIGVAIFVTTVIGAFVALPGSQGLSLAGKIFLLIDLIFLFLSIAFGIIHLLVIKNMWWKITHNLVLTRDVMESLEPALTDEAKLSQVANMITKSVATTMAFFYLQLATLGLGVTIFLGLIITLLF